MAFRSRDLILREGCEIYGKCGIGWLGNGAVYSFRIKLGISSGRTKESST